MYFPIKIRRCLEGETTHPSRLQRYESFLLKRASLKDVLLEMTKEVSFMFALLRHSTQSWPMLVQLFLELAKELDNISWHRLPNMQNASYRIV